MSIVRYRVPEAHLTETVRDGATLQGSIHHPEITEFAGIVTRSHDDGSHDIVIFPPDKGAQHVHHVPEAVGPGSLTFVAEHPRRKAH